MTRGILGFAGLAFMIATSANAATCQQRANNCVGYSGGEACYHSSPSCATTKIYVAPSGRTWEAKGGGPIVSPFASTKK